MRKTWVEDIRTWNAPDPIDDGITLLAETLNELEGGAIGTPMGPETHIRMPMADFERLKTLTASPIWQAGSAQKAIATSSRPPRQHS